MGLSIGLSLSLTRAGVAMGWTPLAVSSLAALHDPNDLSTLFQDTAGTTPVTAVGQTVKLIRDKSGKGVHVINATGWVLAVTDSGRYYLAADGVSAFSGAYTQAAYPLTLACAARATANQQGSVVSLYRSTSEYYAIEKSTTAAEWKAFDRQGVSILTNAEASGDNNGPHVLVASYALGSFDLRIDGIDPTAATTSTNTFGVPSTLLIGSTRSGSLFFKGNYFGSAVFSGALTTAERGRLESYFAGKSWMNLDGALTGKTIAFVGDSITENGDYPVRAAARLGAKALKFGFGGCRMGDHDATGDGPYYDPMCMHSLAHCLNTGDFTPLTSGADALFARNGDDNRPQATAFASQNWSAVDYMVIFFGTNDWGGNLPLGTSSDTGHDTFMGACNYVASQIKATYPNMKIAFIGPMFRSRNAVGDGKDSDTYPNANGDFLATFTAAVLERASANGCASFDAYHGSGIGPSNAATYLVDGLHPTAPLGYQRVGDFVADFLVAAY